MKPHVTVVIPTYNRSTTVVDAVTSVFNQSIFPFETIVVDDGSSDDTHQALAPFKNFIRYIRTENRGVSAARNRGILEARGNYIAFLDSDDTWRHDKLERQIECLLQTKTRLSFCVSVDELGNRLDDLHLMDPHLKPGCFRSYSKSQCMLFKYARHPFLQSLVVDKELLIRAGAFDESLSVAEDTKLIYRLVLDNDYSVVNEPLVRVSRSRSVPGLSDTLDPQSAFTRYVCYCRVQSDAYFHLSELDKESARVAKSNMLYFRSRLAEIACALQKRETARKYALASLTLRNGLTCLARSALIFFAYPVAVRLYVRKWYPPTPMDQAASFAKPAHFKS